MSVAPCWSDSATASGLLTATLVQSLTVPAPNQQYAHPRTDGLERVFEEGILDETVRFGFVSVHFIAYRFLDLH